jgi:hypothetical protein
VHADGNWRAYGGDVWYKFKIDLRSVVPVKFVYSEKATKFCKISTLLLSTVHTNKSKVEISQNFVAFSEYMNFKSTYRISSCSFGP